MSKVFLVITDSMFKYDIEVAVFATNSSARQHAKRILESFITSEYILYPTECEDIRRLLADDDVENAAEEYSNIDNEMLEIREVEING